MMPDDIYDEALATRLRHMRKCFCHANAVIDDAWLNRLQNVSRQSLLHFTRWAIS